MGWKRKNVGRKKTRIPVPQKPPKRERPKTDYDRKAEKKEAEKEINETT